MTKSELIADLEFASAIAKDGAHTPLLGGPIGLMWGCLLIPTLILHGSTLLGLTPLAIEQIGFVWAAYGVIGTVLSIILGRRISAKAGSASMLNRLSGALGTAMGILIFAYAITTVVLVLKNDMPSYLYNFIIVVGFALGCLHGTVLGALSQRNYLKYCGLISGVFMVICLLMVKQNEVYFVGAVGIVLTQIIPNIMEIRGERHG